MKRSHWLCAAIFSLMSAPALAMTGNINGFFGQKALDEDDWGALDRQTELGLMIDTRDSRWPISIAVDLLASWDTVERTGTDLTGTTLELDLGVRKVFDISASALHPYVGGGLAMVGVDLERDVASGMVSDDDTSAGYWVSAGAFWTFANNLNLGLDIRSSAATVDLFGNSVKAGGVHAGILLGYHW